MTIVKICGVREPVHAVIAAQAGADLIGMILAPSRRQISPEKAAEIVQAVRGSTSTPPKMVGVFVDADAQDVNRIAREAGLDMVQLNGSENEDYLEKMTVPVIKAVHVSAGLPGPVAWMGLRKQLAFLRNIGVVPLLDPKVAGVAGGSGQTFDWDVAKGQSEVYDFLLAGGLTPDNVAEAVSRLQPWGVDVSTGVESQGVKDPEKIRLFIERVRQTQAGQAPGR